MEICVCASEFAQKATVRNRKHHHADCAVVSHLELHISTAQIILDLLSNRAGQSRYREENHTTNTSIPRAVGAEAALWKPSNLY